ncbi:zinc finger protein 45-like [Mus caroli]|uniref:Zinc finger protein 45-like n=1 Tax=Mus caroli TaxID=10089 RepID=A0A6P7R8M8_MUSCR|nr:zinc finger protein 45-like [Mus caroli]
MLENFRNVVSLGHQTGTPDGLLGLKREDVFWMLTVASWSRESTGDKNPEEMESLEEVGLRHLPHEALFCSQIWQQCLALKLRWGNESKQSHCSQHLTGTRMLLPASLLMLCSGAPGQDRFAKVHIITKDEGSWAFNL